MRPVDDDLVGGREPRRRREHRPGVAHRDPVAEERALLRDGRGEVDGAEHQHPRPRRVAGDEDLHALAAALAVGPVGEHLAAAGREQAAGVVGDGGVGARRAQRSARPRPAGPPAAGPPRPASGWAITVATATGRCASMSSATASSSGKVRRDTGSTKTSRMPPQVRPDREGVVVADPVALQHRGTRCAHHLGGQLVDRALDAAARHRPAHRAVGRHHHRRARRAAGPTGRCAPRSPRRRCRRPRQTASSSPSTSRTAIQS